MKDDRVIFDPRTFNRNLDHQGKHVEACGINTSIKFLHYKGERSNRLNFLPIIIFPTVVLENLQEFYA